MHIRPYQQNDTVTLTEIFYNTVHNIGAEHYTNAQIAQWAPLPIDYERFAGLFEKWPPFVADIDGKVVGFITLTPHGHIEWTYTHHDYQRQGIASQLYQYLLKQARAKKLTRLTVNASKFARPFFEKQEFEVVEQVNTERNGEVLINWLMSLTLIENQ